MIPEKFDEFTIIVRNSAKCLFCNQEIESKHIHDFVTCSCGMLSVDGGKDYLKRCFKEFDDFIDTSEARYMSLDEIEKQKQRWLSLSKSEFGKYYTNKVKLAEEYINYLKYGDEND